MNLKKYLIHSIATICAITSFAANNDNNAVFKNGQPMLLQSKIGIEMQLGEKEGTKADGLKIVDTANGRNVFEIVNSSDPSLDNVKIADVSVSNLVDRLIQYYLKDGKNKQVLVMLFKNWSITNSMAQTIEDSADDMADKMNRLITLLGDQAHLYEKFNYRYKMDMSFTAMTNNAINFFYIEDNSAKLTRIDIENFDEMWSDLYAKSFPNDVVPKAYDPSAMIFDALLPPEKTYAYIVMDCAVFDPEKIMFHAGNSELISLIMALHPWHSYQPPEIFWFEKVPEVFSAQIPKDPWVRKENAFWRYFDKCLESR